MSLDTSESKPLTPAQAAVLRASVSIPDHVVFRSFVQETVLLNVNTGRYHGVNPTGGRMLEILQQRGSVAAAAEQLAQEYGQPLQEIQRDLCSFCADLAKRGLIEVSGAGDA